MKRELVPLTGTDRKPKKEKPAETPDLFTASQAAAYCSVTRARIYQAVDAGQLARAGGDKALFTKEALDAWQGRPHRVGARNSAISLPCTNCGKPLLRWPSKTSAETGNAFCDRACFLSWRHGKGQA